MKRSVPKDQVSSHRMKSRRKRKPELLRNQPEPPHCAAAATSADAVVTSDSGGSHPDVEPGGERIFGYGEEIVHEPVATLIPVRYRRDHREGVRRF